MESPVTLMPTWSKAVMRTVGALNTAFALVGAWWMVSTARWALFRLEPQPEAPFFKSVFSVMTGINTVLIVLFLVAAIQLLSLRKSGIIVHAVASTVLITYSVLNGVLWRLRHGVGMSIAAATGIGNVGIALFEFAFIVPYLYPITSTLALLFARRSVVSHAANAGGTAAT